MFMMGFLRILCAESRRGVGCVLRGLGVEVVVGCYGIEFMGCGLGRNTGWRGMVWLLHDLEDSGC